MLGANVDLSLPTSLGQYWANIGLLAGIRLALYHQPHIHRLAETAQFTFGCHKHFDSIFSPHMSGFRKNFSCEHVSTNFIESAKRALDDQTYVGSVMTYLSRAFDCLSSKFMKLLLSKLHVYGVAEGSCRLLSSYFVNRTQRVKIGTSRSPWETIYKGAAQGSIMRPPGWDPSASMYYKGPQGVCNSI